jgi:hypothetical protein
MKTASCSRQGVTYRNPLPHCRCGNVIPRKDKNLGAVNCPACVARLQEEMRKAIEGGRVRFAELKGAA